MRSDAQHRESVNSSVRRSRTAPEAGSTAAAASARGEQWNESAGKAGPPIVAGCRSSSCRMQRRRRIAASTVICRGRTWIGSSSWMTPDLELIETRRGVAVPMAALAVQPAGPQRVTRQQPTVSYARTASPVGDGSSALGASAPPGRHRRRAATKPTARCASGTDCRSSSSTTRTSKPRRNWPSGRRDPAGTNNGPGLGSGSV